VTERAKDKIIGDDLTWVRVYDALGGSEFIFYSTKK